MKRNKERRLVCYADDDTPFTVFFDYDKGEEQWFDARAGVGSPGYPAEVIVNAVDFGSGRESPDVYPQLNMDAIEQACMDAVIAEEEKYWAEFEERETARMQEAQ